MKIIAYYLPQYHNVEENNNWWGENFTEWTNVKKATPLFKNHIQPKIPGELGYYDLLDNSIKLKQAELAKKSNLTGFCYWHYWFGNGKQLLEKPINQIYETGTPEFPFCLGWANETWKKKSWSSDESKDIILIEQKYPDIEDFTDHFYKILPLLNDERYIKINNRPLFVVYKPLDIPPKYDLIKIWNNLAIKNGFNDGLFFVGHTINNSEYTKIINLGYDAVNIVRIGEHKFNFKVILKILPQLFCFKFLKRPLKLNYKFISKYFIQNIDKKNNVIPSVIPNWDHTPRSGNRGVVFHNSTPILFKKHLINAFNAIKNKPKDKQILFIKSWNEWGEGNYLEPDSINGTKYLEILEKTLNELNCENNFR